MNAGEIQEEINKKKAELSNLIEQFEEAVKAEYGFLVGKCYSLAATCKIKVLDINHVDERYGSVGVVCVRIQGGKYDNGRIEIETTCVYDLQLKDIDEELIGEISQAEFNEFLVEALDMPKLVLLKNI